MKIYYLLKDTIRMISSRKIFFLMSAIMLCVTFLIIDYQSIVVGLLFYQKNIVKSIIDENIKNVYFMDFGKYIMPMPEDSAALSEFGIGVKSIDGIKYSGICYEDGIGIDTGNIVVAISADLFPLCELKNVQGNDISIEYMKTLTGRREKSRETDNIQPIIVGYDLKDDFPIGYMFESHSEQYVVTDILAKGSKWFEDRLDFGNLEVDLDDCIIVDEDCRLRNGDDRLTGLASFIFVPEPDADVKQVKKNIRVLARQCGLDLYNEYSVEKKLQNNRNTIFDEAYDYYMVVAILVLSVVVAVVCSVINVFLRKRSIGVMYAVGYSTRDVQFMVLMENIIKIGFAFVLSYAYWSVHEREIYDLNISILNYMFPYLLFGFVVIVFCSSILPIKWLSSMYPAKLIGGKE